MKSLVIVDYGMGNIGSVVNAFKKLGTDCIVADSPELIKQAQGIVLPGVGAFHAAMQNLRLRGLEDALHEHVLHHKKPFLGICLGMQLLAESSMELQYSKGLGWIKGHVVPITAEPPYRIPHVGWNNLNQTIENNLFTQLEESAHFFFDHSYHLKCEENVITATCHYGPQQMTASIQKENIFAVQFHPEKSQRNGLKLLRNFLNAADLRLSTC